METLHITSTRKSPENLSSLGFKDGDLVTVSAIIDAVMDNIKRKAKENLKGANDEIDE